MYIERRQPQSNVGMLAADIAPHLYARQFEGIVIVAGKEPLTLLRVVRKQWMKMMRTAQRERSMTLDSTRIIEFSRVISHMQQLKFVSRTPSEEPDAQVFL